MDGTAFASEWQSGWNAHDLDRIVAHYTDDVVFRSRKAIALTGSGEIRGKPALRAYWAAALAAQPDLHFRIEQVLLGHDALVILYLNHRDVRAAETLWFDPSGLVSRASACHAS